MTPSFAMPVRKLTRGFSPTLNSQRPLRVNLITANVITAIAHQRTTIAGTRPRPRWPGPEPSDRAPLGVPPEKTREAPSIMLFMARVMMIGEIRSLTMPKPLTEPVTSPTATAATAAGTILASWPSQISVKTSADPVSTQAIERSIPPLSMTTVCPMAARPRNEDSFRNWRILSKAQNRARATHRQDQGQGDKTSNAGAATRPSHERRRRGGRLARYLGDCQILAALRATNPALRHFRPRSTRSCRR